MNADAIAIAAAVDSVCSLQFNCVPYRPASLSARMAFVAPSDPWKQYDEDGGFCAWSTGLDVWLVAGSADQPDAYDWLDEQTTLLLEAGTIATAADRIAVEEVGAPFVFAEQSGATFLACRVTYSRFRS